MYTTFRNNTRKKLIDLRKKYIIDDVKIYDKNKSSSDDISSGDTRIGAHSSRSLSKNINVEDNDKNVKEQISPGSASGDTNDNLSYDVNKSVVKDTRVFTQQNVLSDDVIDKISVSSFKSKLSKNSSISSIKSEGSNKYSFSEVEEIISDYEDGDVDSSPILKPLANVHLVSDEVLEELDASIESRISKKINDDDDTTVSVNSLSLEKQSVTDDIQLTSGKNFSFKSETDRYASENSEINYENTSTKQNNEVVESVVIDYQSNESTINSVEVLDNLNHNSAEKVKSKSKNDEILSEAVVYNSSSSNDTSNKSKETCNLNYINGTQIVNLRENKTFIDEKISPEILSRSYQTDDIGKEKHKSMKHKGINVNLEYHEKDKRSNDIGVQTDEENILRFKRRWYINTSVSNEKFRPIIKSSKNHTAKGESVLENSNKTEVMTVDKLVDEMLHNQIELTKNFIDSHHELYLHCCKTVKALNEHYKNNKTTLFTA